MSSKRHARRTACTGKIRFASAAIADVEVRKLRQGGRNPTLESYHCRFCSAFHIGHHPQGRQHRSPTGGNHAFS